MLGAGVAARARMRSRTRGPLAPASTPRPPHPSTDESPAPISEHWAAREAVERLVRERPSASAKRASRHAGAVLLAALAVAVAVGALAPALAWTALVAATTACFVALCAFRACAALVPTPRPAPPGQSRTDPPIYTVLVPLHRESEVVAELGTALGALAYPGLMQQAPEALSASRRRAYRTRLLASVARRRPCGSRRWGRPNRFAEQTAVRVGD